jgi:hypothetical protein
VEERAMTATALAASDLDEHIVEAFREGAKSSPTLTPFRIDSFEIR